MHTDVAFCCFCKFVVFMIECAYDWYVKTTINSPRTLKLGNCWEKNFKNIIITETAGQKKLIITVKQETHHRTNTSLLHCVSKKTGPLRLLWHNFSSPQNLLISFGRDRLHSILDWYNKKFISCLRTSCVVSITTVATWHTWTANFWADFEHRVIDIAITE